jgi:hypothetical protein
MHIFQLLDLFALTPKVEIVEAALPNVMKSVRGTGQPSRKSQLYRLHHGRWIGNLGLRNEKMDMLRHHDIANHSEAISVSHLLQHGEQQVPPRCAMEQRLALVATPRNQVQTPRAVVTLQAPRHW